MSATIMNEIAFGLMGSSIIVVSTIVTILVVYFHKKSKRVIIWPTPTSAQAVTNSAPISRRSSSSCLITIEKQQQPPRSRSASFGEDLTARLQSLATGSSYRPYAPPTINPSLRLVRSTPTANIRASIAPTDEPPKSNLPSVTFQLRFEQTVETLFITIFQLQDSSPVKSTCHHYLILYLLPNDDEKRQTHPSSSGVFNEDFQFPLKPDELLQRTLRLTAYTVDATTRIRNTLGHLFVKFDQFLPNKDVKSFPTNTLCEVLTQDLQITPAAECLGELLVTSSYSKERRMILIRVQKIDHLRVDRSKTKTQAPVALKGYLSGQVLVDLSKSVEKNQWVHTTSFPVYSSTSIRIERELALAIRPVSTPVNDDDELVECHLRLHLQGLSPVDQVHSHAQWQYSLRSSSPDTRTVPLVASIHS